MRHARAAALRIGALAGARIQLAPQAGIAAQAGSTGASPADADGTRIVGPPDQRDQDQRKDDSQ